MRKSKSLFRRILAIFMMLAVMLTLGGCGSEAGVAGEVADPNDFLKDMAKGLEAREALLVKVDISSMSQEELMEHYRELVECELDRIGKYAEMTFADTDFEALAHLYISACEMQLEATEQYKDSALYYGLWSGGYTTRAAIIGTMYEKYDLPITAEMRSIYQSGAVNITVTNGGGNDVTTLNEVHLTKRDRSVTLIDNDDVTVKIEGYEMEYGYLRINMEVHNRSDKEIWINFEDIAIEGYQITGYGSSGINPGMKKKDNISIYEDKISEAGIKSWGKLEANIEVYGNGFGVLYRIPVIIDRNCWD